MNLTVVIPSRQRSALLTANALRLFPDAVVTVAASERDAYAGVVPDDRLILHDDAISGIAPIRQWVLDSDHPAFAAEALVFADDDVFKLTSMVGVNPVPITHPGDIRQVLLNAATIAQGIGAPVFGFNQSGNVREFSALEPFAFHRWFGGVIGFVGRTARYDTALRLRADIDLCLQVLRDQRVTFQDGRFMFHHRRFGVTGGNAANRSAQRNAEEIAYLQRKWGAALEVKDVKGTTRLIMHVPRRQSGITLASAADDAPRRRHR